MAGCHRRIWFVMGVALSVCGCASWSFDAPPEDRSLPPPRMASDSVVLEVAFVRFDVLDSALEDELWRQVDEQHLPVEVRRRLEQNGIRTGLLGTQLPDVIRSALDQPNDLASLLADEHALSGAPMLMRQHRLQLRAEQPELVALTSQEHDSLVVLLRQEDAVRASRFERAIPQIRITSFPSGDGQVQLEVVPEIEHGETRQRWVGSQGTLILDTGREHTAFDELKFTTRLSPGQTLLLTTTTDQKGLGQQFFGSADPDSHDRVFLLFRLAQTQLDDLFSPDRPHQPLMAVSP